MDLPGLGCCKEGVGDDHRDDGVDGEAAVKGHGVRMCQWRRRCSRGWLGEQALLKLELIVDFCVMCPSLRVKLVQVGLQGRIRGGRGGRKGGGKIEQNFG